MNNNTRTRAWKRHFLRDLAKNVVKRLIEQVDAGKLPPEWDGFELRALLADAFARDGYKMRGARKRDYDNTVLVNNLA